jgi:hypothetical protein
MNISDPFFLRILSVNQEARQKGDSLKERGRRSKNENEDVEF